MSTKKIDKEFCITDNSVNVYKYRCLTSGLQLDEVKKNPIGYFNHGTEDYPRNAGVLVRWDDFRKEGDKVFAKPIINLLHPRGSRTVSEIESGFLNAASVGKIVVLDASSEKNLMLPGQTKPTITNWFPREISLVDIPGNYNAFSDLCDKDFKEINLLDVTNNVDSIEISKILKALNMSSGNEKDIFLKIDKLFLELNRLRESESELNGIKKGSKYENRSWEDLYRSDELETVRQKHPKLYEKLKKEKFNS